MSCNCGSNLNQSISSGRYLVVGGRRKKGQQTKKQNFRKSRLSKKKKMRTRRSNRKNIKSRKIRSMKGGAGLLGDNITRDVNVVSNISGFQYLDSNVLNQPIEKISNYNV